MMFTRYIGCVFAALIAGGSCALVAAERVPAQAQGSGPRQRVEAQFGGWLAGSVWPDAQQQGSPRARFDRAVALPPLIGVFRNCSHWPVAGEKPARRDLLSRYRPDPNDPLGCLMTPSVFA
jgi:hypothetical protein